MPVSKEGKEKKRHSLSFQVDFKGEELRLGWRQLRVHTRCSCQKALQR